jgi:hypothetical protein
MIMCNSCDALVINGVVCHETGCPDAWKKEKECANCDNTFVPMLKDQKFCSDECYYDYWGIDNGDIERA